MDALAATIETETEDWPVSAEWTTFIMNRRQTLIDEATSVSVRTEEWNKYRYRPHAFFQRHNGPIALTWVMMYINNLTRSSEFDGLDTVLVPSKTTLQTIADSYETYQQQLSNEYQLVG